MKSFFKFTIYLVIVIGSLYFLYCTIDNILTLENFYKLTQAQKDLTLSNFFSSLFFDIIVLVGWYSFATIQIFLYKIAFKNKITIKNKTDDDDDEDDENDN